MTTQQPQKMLYKMIVLVGVFKCVEKVVNGNAVVVVVVRYGCCS
jgi:hypothetical protein